MPSSSASRHCPKTARRCANATSCSAMPAKASLRARSAAQVRGGGRHTLRSRSAGGRRGPPSCSLWLPGRICRCDSFAESACRAGTGDLRSRHPLRRPAGDSGGSRRRPWHRAAPGDPDRNKVPRRDAGSRFCTSPTGSTAAHGPGRGPSSCAAPKSDLLPSPVSKYPRGGPSHPRRRGADSPPPHPPSCARVRRDLPRWRAGSRYPRRFRTMSRQSRDRLPGASARRSAPARW